MTSLRPILAMRLSGNLQGMGWMLLTTMMIVSMHTFIRQVTPELHPFEVAFFRNLFGAPIAVALIAVYGRQVFRTERIRIHVVRSLGHVSAMMMFFLGISTTQLATANALGFAAPLFASALAMVFLGERFRWRRWGALMFGFAGALVILRPGFIEIGTGPLLILCSSFVWGTILVVIKALGRHDAPPTIIVYMVLMMTPLSLIPAAFVWTWPTWHQLGLMFVMGMVGTAGHLTLAQALRLADTAVVLPIDFFRLVWASALGVLIFSEIPDLFTWVGGTMIFAGATYLAVRERSEARTAQRAAVPTPSR